MRASPCLVRNRDYVPRCWNLYRIRVEEAGINRTRPPNIAARHHNNKDRLGPAIALAERDRRLVGN